MKCVQCQKDSNYKDRAGKKCPHCQHAFAFEPKDGDPVTDMLFLNAVKAVSGEGRIKWGVEHLYYEVCRRKRKMGRVPLGCVGFALILGAILVGVGLSSKSKDAGSMTLVGIVGVFIGLALLASRTRGKFVPITKEKFDGLWRRWVAVMGKPSSVIERAAHNAPAEPLEADIADYSFDRAVICDRARTVDLLVANNFHFENNCAVLSIDGYPKGVFATIRGMLKRNPRLQVFVLHDSSLAGCRLAQRLITDPEWFGGSGLRVIDLGLRPRHAKPFHGVLLPGDGVRLNDEPGVTPAEAEWLTQHTLELAAARPEQVLKRLFAGLTAHANDDPRTADGSGAVTTCGAFDAGGYGGGDGVSGGEGGADAFG